MSVFHEIKPSQLSGDLFTKINDGWFLITAKKGDKVNTMTASWGGLGIMWHKNVSYMVIRPQRYTKELIDAADHYSITFFDNSHKKALAYLGKASGRDENKIDISGLTLDEIDGVPYFKEASEVLICSKLLAVPYTEDCFIDKSIIDVNYPMKDFHTLYIGEIVKTLRAE